MSERLVLEGVIVKSVAMVRDSILDALHKDDEIRLDIAEGAPVDVCGLQLIESARRFTESAGKKLLLERPAEDFRSILQDAGFLTNASAEDLGFWFHQENIS